MTARTHADIYLSQAEDRKFDGYGLVFTSDTRHLVANRRQAVTDRTPYLVQVYENRTSWHDGNPTGIIVDALGNPTNEPYSFILQGQATMIASTPVQTEPWGDTLSLGDVVSLRVGHYRLGTFLVEVDTNGHDPKLTLVSR